MASALGLALVWAFGCSSPTKDVFAPDEKTYQVAGSLIKEPNSNIASALMQVFKNGDTAETMTILVGDDTLLYNGPTFDQGVYGRVLGPADSLLLGSAPVYLADSTVFADTLFAVVPGKPVITDISPQLKGTSDPVRVTWNAAVNAEGYIVAAVKQDSVFDGIGWTQFVDQALTLVTINDSAFTRFNLQGGEPNPGLYYIFVYAYTGAPDSALSALRLPVPLPAQLDDNLDGGELAGRVGTVVVSNYGVVEVLAN